ncbi:MAG: carboxypeptidase regulatory-like domain-containing protein [Alphaproteobacteria bacterium]|nr:carboxypeptidase regulatory-like domain-containing protein [Alphaproteobacteria bacterium]
MPNAGYQERGRSGREQSSSTSSSTSSEIEVADESNQAMQEAMSEQEADTGPTLRELRMLQPNSVGGFVAQIIDATGTCTPISQLLPTQDPQDLKRAITRGESAMVIYNALELGETFEGKPTTFDDVPMSYDCAVPLYRCREEGIFEGPGQDRFMPYEMLRAEHVLPLTQLVETWNDSMGADTQMLDPGDLFDTDPVFMEDAMGLKAEGMGSAMTSQDSAGAQQVMSTEQALLLPSQTAGGFTARLLQAQGSSASPAEVLAGMDLNGPLTRAQAAVLMARVMGLGDRLGGQPAVYNDLPLSHWAASAVYRCQEEGIMGAAVSGGFAPSRTLDASSAEQFVQQSQNPGPSGPTPVATGPQEASNEPSSDVQQTPEQALQGQGALMTELEKIAASQGGGAGGQQGGVASLFGNLFGGQLPVGGAEAALLVGRATGDSARLPFDRASATSASDTARAAQGDVQAAAVLDSVTASVSKATNTRPDQVLFVGGTLRWGVGRISGGDVARQLDAYLKYAADNGLTDRLQGYFGGSGQFDALRDRFAAQGDATTVTPAELAALQALGRDRDLAAAHNQIAKEDVAADLARIGDMKPAYPFIDDRNTISELAAHVFTHAIRFVGDPDVVHRAVLARLGGDPDRIAQTVGERAFLGFVRDAVLRWVQPNERRGVEMSFREIFNNYGTELLRYPLGNTSKSNDMEGQVNDENGRPVANQRVTVRSTRGEEFTARTNVRGFFWLSAGLTPGDYTVELDDGVRQAVQIVGGQTSWVELQAQQGAGEA